MTDGEINELVQFILEKGSYDGKHFKQWVLDQTLRKLLKDKYHAKIDEWNSDKKYERWYEGIEP